VVCDHITRAKVASAPKDRIEHIHFSGRDSDVDFFWSVCTRESRGVVRESTEAWMKVFADWSFTCGCAGLWM
jgi:hypothetical protein